MHVDHDFAQKNKHLNKRFARDLSTFNGKSSKKTSSMRMLTTHQKEEKKNWSRMCTHMAKKRTEQVSVCVRARRATATCLFSFLICCCIIAHFSCSFSLPLPLHSLFFPPSTEAVAATAASSVCRVRFASSAVCIRRVYAVKWYTLDPLSRRVDCDMAVCRHVHTATNWLSERVSECKADVHKYIDDRKQVVKPFLY